MYKIELKNISNEITTNYNNQQAFIGNNKAKIGRPTKSNENKKKNRINIYLDKHDYYAIMAHMESIGYDNFSSYAREMLLRCVNEVKSK